MYKKVSFEHITNKQVEYYYSICLITNIICAYAVNRLIRKNGRISASLCLENHVSVRISSI